MRYKTFKQMQQWASEENLRVNHLSTAWVRLDWNPAEYSGWHKIKAFVRWVLLNIWWRVKGFLRHRHDLKRWWALRKSVKKHSAYLKKEIERLQNAPPHEPPSQEEVAEFVKWAENSGIRFANRVQPMPKTPVSSREVDLTSTGM